MDSSIFVQIVHVQIWYLFGHVQFVQPMLSFCWAKSDIHILTYFILDLSQLALSNNSPSILIFYLCALFKFVSGGDTVKMTVAEATNNWHNHLKLYLGIIKKVMSKTTSQNRYSF